jgi:ubiquinol-cytochrome c reductase core subunit 2
VKIAALDHGQPTSAVTFLVKAGSRYEPQPGVANALKNFAFKACILPNRMDACVWLTLLVAEHRQQVSVGNRSRDRVAWGSAFIESDP